MSSIPLRPLGGHAFNDNVYHPNSGAEAEYDRLRALARQEHDQRSRCLDQARRAYEHGDGATAHERSEQAKHHARLMDQYNRQASDFIFRQNNPPDLVPSDTIDLHGQFAQEAEDILAQRIQAARARGDHHLHVVVGKGSHSIDHIQKLKPRVEQLCRDLGLQYNTEENAGRIYVDLAGGRPAHPHPPRPHQPHQPPGTPSKNQSIGKLIFRLLKRLLCGGD